MVVAVAAYEWMTHLTPSPAFASSRRVRSSAHASQSPIPVRTMYFALCFFRPATISSMLVTTLFHTAHVFSISMLEFPIVAAGLAANAAVWDAFSMLMFSGKYVWGGISCSLIAAALQTLALCTMQPHVLAAVNGCGVVLCLALSSDTFTAKSAIAAGCVVAGSVVGLAGITPKTSPVRTDPHTMAGVFFGLFVGLDFYPLYVYMTEGGFGKTRLRYVLPVADACVAAATTSMLMAQATSESLLAGSIPTAIVGCVYLASSCFSLHNNHLTTHILVSYPLWSLFLIILDYSGGYHINMTYLSGQFALCSAGICLLVVK